MLVKTTNFYARKTDFNPRWLVRFVEKSVNANIHGMLVRKTYNVHQQAFAGMFMLAVLGVVCCGILSAALMSWVPILGMIIAAASVIASAFLVDSCTVALFDESNCDGTLYTVYPLHLLGEVLFFSPLIWIGLLGTYGFYKAAMVLFHYFQ